MWKAATRRVTSRQKKFPVMHVTARATFGRRRGCSPRPELFAFGLVPIAAAPRHTTAREA